MTVNVGDAAPDFTLPTDGNGSLSLSELRGKKVILYFYPKDDTPGCTTEACAFRDDYPNFTDIGAEVIGVSKDSTAAHDRFKTKHGLPFPLVSDTEGTLCEAYGVWKEKMNYGKKYMGIERSTFLIDGNGVIRNIWRKVKVKAHAEEVLSAVRAL